MQKIDKSLQWLKIFSEEKGPTGYEKRIKNLLTQRLQDMGEPTYDGLGSIIFKTEGRIKEPSIMLAAHMDEIGFMVKHITKEGFIKFVCLGGWAEQVMLGQRVIIHSQAGDYIGVIGSKPPHILSPEERKKLVDKKDMFIDVGAKDYDETTKTFGIQPGDFVTPECTFSVMGNKYYLLSKAWDNRVGCVIMADVFEDMCKTSHPNTFYAVGTVQEEVGLRGAATSANKINPDIALIIDTTIAGDMPGVTPDVAPAKLGDGIAITIYDASLVPNTALRDMAIQIAKKEKIKYQLSFSEGGGTDGGRIHMQGSGVPTLVLSIPTRYIHSHQSIIHYQDYISAVKLITSLVKKLDKTALETILKN